jgi:hypothetical protein
VPFHLADLRRHDPPALTPSTAELNERANDRDQGCDAHYDQYGSSFGVHA